MSLRRRLPWPSRREWYRPDDVISAQHADESDAMIAIVGTGVSNMVRCRRPRSLEERNERTEGEPKRRASRC